MQSQDSVMAVCCVKLDKTLPDTSITTAAGVDLSGTPQSSVRATRTPASTNSRAGSAVLRRSMDSSVPTPPPSRNAARNREAAEEASPMQVASFTAAIEYSLGMQPIWNKTCYVCKAFHEQLADCQC